MEGVRLSTMYFNSGTRTAQVVGEESAGCAALVRDVAVGSLGLHDPEMEDRVRYLLPKSNPARTAIGHEFRTWYASVFGVMSQEVEKEISLMEWRGVPLSAWALRLNTAMVLGNQSVQFAARVAAHFHRFAYVEEWHRSWLTRVIQTALDNGVLCREVNGKPSGWADVMDLLIDGKGPVVLSSSTGYPFPSWEHTGWQQEGEPQESAEERWLAADVGVQWEYALRLLRTQALELRLEPGNWFSYRFGHGLSLLDLRAPDWQERLDRALGTTPTRGEGSPS